ncbi:MAG TPA: hypothetical protein ENJ93_09090 [Chloroflexi bacterium]|nr:hypothetical protein [Chloroflexota bacterium]
MAKIKRIIEISFIFLCLIGLLSVGLVLANNSAPINPAGSYPNPYPYPYPAMYLPVIHKDLAGTLTPIPTMPSQSTPTPPPLPDP